MEGDESESCVNAAFTADLFSTQAADVDIEEHYGSVFATLFLIPFAL